MRSAIVVNVGRKPEKKKTGVGGIKIIVSSDKYSNRTFLLWTFCFGIVKFIKICELYFTLKTEWHLSFFGKFINIKSLTLIWPKITIIYFSKLHKIQSSQLSLITYIWYTITWYTWSVYPSCPSSRLVKSPHRILRFTYQYLCAFVMNTKCFSWIMKILMKIYF